MQLITHVVFGNVQSFPVICYPFNGWFNIHNSRKKIIRVSYQISIRNFSCSLQKINDYFTSCFPLLLTKLKTRRYKQCVSGRQFLEIVLGEIYGVQIHIRNVLIYLFFSVCGRRQEIK